MVNSTLGPGTATSTSVSTANASTSLIGIMPRD
jgi:hypothetical protein